MKLDRGQYDALIPQGCAPVCNAQDEDQVVGHLRELHARPAHRLEVGRRLRDWVLETHGNRKWGRVYDAFLCASAQGRLPGFEGSPLLQACNTEELAYHAAELAAAPPYPNYF